MAVKKQEIKLTIPRANIQLLKVKIVGLSPLIFHRWDEKAIKMIQDKQAKTAKSNVREARNPEAEYEASFYKTKDGAVAFPALSIKQAMVGAARNLEGVTMTLLRGAVFVVGDSDGLIKVNYPKGGKEMRTDMVRVGMGTADVRYRGQVKDWSMDLIIKYNADVLSAEQVVNLLQIAGFSCGLGEWRPERNGDFGTFEVAS